MPPRKKFGTKDEAKGQDTLEQACRSIEQNYRHIHRELVERGGQGGEMAEKTAGVGQVAAGVWFKGLTWANNAWDALSTTDKFKAMDAAQKAITTLAGFVPRHKAERQSDFDSLIGRLENRTRIKVMRQEFILEQ